MRGGCTVLVLVSNKYSGWLLILCILLKKKKKNIKSLVKQNYFFLTVLFNIYKLQIFFLYSFYILFFLYIQTTNIFFLLCQLTLINSLHLQWFRLCRNVYTFLTLDKKSIGTFTSHLCHQSCSLSLWTGSEHSFILLIH